MYVRGSTHIAVGLIEQRWCERSDDGHDKHSARYTSAFRVEVLFLPPHSDADHTHTGHQQNTSQQAPHD
jgi:hypothetical protein